MRRVLGMATATAAAVWFVGISTATAQGLTSVPDNAIVMVKVNNLEKTSQKLGALFQQWGLAAMQPMLADPLAAVQNMGNLQQGIDKSGEAAFVFINPQSLQGQDQAGQPYVVMIPVSDYAAFIKNFPDAEAEGELYMINVPTNQEPAYVAKWGSFAAISPNKALVAARPQATKAAGLSAKQLSDRDIVAYVNFAGFRTVAAMGLGFGRMGAIGQIDQGANANPEKAKYAPVAKVFMNQLFNGLEHFMNETQALTFSVDLSDQGIQITEMCEFAPDSYLGKYTSQWKTPQASIGKGLPQGSYAIVGGSAMDAKSANQLIDDMLGPVIVEARKLGPEVQPVIDYVDSLKESLSATKSNSFALSPGEGKPGETPLFEINMVIEGDAPKIVAAQSKMGQAQNEFQKMANVMQPGNQPKASMQVTKAARTVNGIAFDQLTTTIEGGAGPDDPQFKVLDMIYGKGGMQMLYAPVDNDTVLLTTNKQDAQIGNAVTAAKDNTDILANHAPTKQVAGKLPANSFMTAYLYGDQLTALASRASEAFTGTALQTQVPPDTLPLGMALSTEGSAVKFDMFVPSPLVQTIVRTAMMEAMKKQQNQNRGGGL